MSVVVPVYNQGTSIATNVRTIRDRVAGGVAGDIEVIVVSDGSIDDTEEALLGLRLDGVRVLSYDRNLGKGYAIKMGALAATGDWIAYCDADLDLDPASIPTFLEEARRERLHVAIGSKRHPESRVLYPSSRRAASWFYQQLVRVLFRLDVKDTQVGLKVFPREVAEEVLPLLLVKRYAFDLELLAVARSLGFDRIREFPISLDYRFTGSGVRSVAVLRALVDTAGIFYRLRILRYYRRKRALLGGDEFRRALDYQPLVSVVTTSADAVRRLDYPGVEVVTIPADTPSLRAEGVKRARGELIAFVGAGGRPAGNWLGSAVPFLAREDVAAVVAPCLAPHVGSVFERAAAAVAESRLGGGSAYFRSTPGNLRVVRDYPSADVVVRRKDLLEAMEGGPVPEALCERLAFLGKKTVYTPETVVVRPKARLFRPHLHGVRWYARTRAEALRDYGWRALRLSSVGLFALLASLLAGLVALAADGGSWRLLGAIPWLLYGGAVALSAAIAALRFRSLAVAAAAAAGLIATHLVYAASFLRALLGRAHAGSHPQLARYP